MSCCLIWRVDWTRDEVEKLKNAECSEHLRELINSSFKENGEKYMIQMDDKKRCPFLTEDNFCSIQRELGEEYLSHTCTVYPRNSRLSGNTILSYCNLSCYHIMDMLCNDKDCMILENYRPAVKKSGRATIDNEVDILNHPELKYRHQLFEYFYEIISDDSYSVETAVTLGALSAQSISKLINKGAYDKIPDSLSALKKQLKNPEQLKKLEEIKPNYAVKFGFLNELNKVVIKSNVIDMISENGGISINKYHSGMESFCSDFSERPFALRNIALNLLLECKMPFRDKNYSFFENYCYYAAAFAAIKLVAAAIYASGSNQEKGFKISSAYISRYFAHDDAKVKQVLDVFNKLNCMSPAYIALIVN